MKTPEEIEKLPNEIETICPACGGDGMVQCYRIVPECCGDFNKHGGCCDNPNPRQVPDIEQCSYCHATGIINEIIVTKIT